MDNIMMERRKFMRFDVPLPIAFKSPHRADSLTDGVMVNFSREGFCFQSGLSEFTTDRDIEFNIRMPHSGDDIPVTGDVVWIEKNKEGSLAGVRINEIGNDAKFEILDYAYDLWLEKMRG